MAALKQHFLISAFADYYQELVRAKRAINEGNLADYLGVRTQDRAPTNQQLIGILYRRLKTRLTEQQRQIRASATAFEQRDYLRVLYAACALTDEQLLFDVDWGEAEVDLWQQGHLMEAAFFGTDFAGSRLFEYAEQILQDRTRVKNQSDLAAVYLITLTLGFKGKYRVWTSTRKTAVAGDSVSLDAVDESHNDSASAQNLEEDPLAVCKARLYRVIEVPLARDQVFAQAYEYLLYLAEDPKAHRIAPLRQWYRYGLLALLAYLLLSSIVWLSLTLGLSDQIQSMETAQATTIAPVVSALWQTGGGDHV